MLFILIRFATCFDPIGHHHAFTTNQLTIKLRTFLGSQTMFTGDNHKQFIV